MKNHTKIYKSLTALLVAVGVSQGSEVAAQQAVNADSLVQTAFGLTAKDDLLGGVSNVNVAELMKKDYHTGALSELSGLVSGYTGAVWGQSPLYLVDGAPANYVRPSEIESITVLKGADAVALYGSKGAKGVVLINTKHGKEQPLQVDVTANTGFYFAKSYPKYLDAAEYMTYYNQAYRNDGNDKDYYDEATIYNTAAGTNPYRYPDMNFYSSDYLKKSYNRTDGSVEISGGTDKAAYYANVGMDYSGSPVKYGDKGNDKILNFYIRGNVDMNITNWLKGTTNAAVNIGNSYNARGDFWGAAASIRPNWYTALVPIDMLDQDNKALTNLVKESNNVIDGKYLLGGNNANQTTVYGDMLKAGYIKGRTRSFLFDQTLTAALNGITPGLSFTAAFGIDYWNDYNEAWNEGYATYQPVWSNMSGKDMIIALNQFGEDKNSTNEYIGQSYDTQYITARFHFDYNRSFNDVNNFSATLLGWGYQQQQSSDSGHGSSDAHKVSNFNGGLRAAYNYDQKYYVTFSSALVHSAKLAEGHRNAFSPSIALGWRISKEDFFNIDFFNNLKINAAYSVLNQDIDLSQWYMYQGSYKVDGRWYQWQDGSQGGWSAVSDRGGNEDLDFIKRKEYRIGLEGGIMDNMVSFEVNYFNQLTDGLTTNGASTIYPSYFNSIGSFLPFTNFNQDLRKGWDFSVNFNKKMGEVNTSLGFVGMAYNTEAKKRDEYFADDYQYRAGKDLSTAWGYECEGFFKNQTAIDNHAKQTFGDVKPGDLAYKDQNGDGTIDSKDQVSLGSYTPNFYYGINLTVNWKNFTLFAIGTGQCGGIGFKNNGYYWLDGNSKFSEVVRGAWTVGNADQATYPRLTTGYNLNNKQTSTFWKYSTNQFNLSKVQLTYDFPSAMFGGRALKGVSVYFSGSNLLMISKEREYMEMNIGSAPQCRFYNLGVKVHF